MTAFSSPMSRRRLHALGAGALALALPTLAGAQGAANWPSKPVTIIVPYQAGGGTDVIARLVALKLADRLKKPFVVDNRGGAGGIIGTSAVAKAAPDGHTLVVGLATSLLANQYLYTKLPYNPNTDLAMVYRLARGVQILVTKPSLPVKTGTDLIAYIKANKGKLSYGSYGQGSTPHLWGAYLNDLTGGDMTHVAYKGEAPLIQDLLGGQIDMTWLGVAGGKPHIEAGKVKAIGVNAPMKADALPNVPTLKDVGMTQPPFQLFGWVAVAVPAKTPKDIQEKLAATLREIMKDPEVQRKAVDMGMSPLTDSGPEKFTAEYNAEKPMWADLVKVSGAKLD